MSSFWLVGWGKVLSNQPTFQDMVAANQETLFFAKYLPEEITYLESKDCQVTIRRTFLVKIGCGSGLD
jgi:hypothetical protein